MLRVLVNQYQPRKPEILLKALPQEEIKAILSQEVQPDAIKFVCLSPEEILQKVHYSWLKPEIEKWPSPIREMIVLSLPEPQISKLLPLCGTSAGMSPSSSSLTKKFMLSQFYAKLGYKEILPAACLPISPLSPLIEWKKERLIELLDLLSMYDLVAEVRQMIDKNQVMRLQNALSPLQRIFLRSLLPQKEKVTGTPLKLKDWNGVPQQLQQLLQKRGIARIGKALCGQHPDFLWHLTHILDIGRGNLIASCYSTNSFPGVTPALVQQVVNVMNFLNHKE